MAAHDFGVEAAHGLPRGIQAFAAERIETGQQHAGQFRSSSEGEKVHQYNIGCREQHGSDRLHADHTVVAFEFEQHGRHYIQEFAAIGVSEVPQ